MNENDVIAYLIETQPIEPTEVQEISSMSPADMIKRLISLKGGFVFRAYLLERLMEVTNGPRGLAVPKKIYEERFLAKVNREK